VDDPAAAVAWLEPITGLLRQHAFSEPGLITAPPDLIEAYARAGRVEDAVEYLQWFQDAAARLDNAWARLTSSRAEAVLNLARGELAAAVEAVTPAVAWAQENLRRVGDLVEGVVAELQTQHKAGRLRVNPPMSVEEFHVRYGMSWRVIS
jgi:hypothetical protein